VVNKNKKVQRFFHGERSSKASQDTQRNTRNKTTKQDAKKTE
jgi:hypothetical protein